jgi:uncharacterized protein YuzB (UPF0349 family)
MVMTIHAGDCLSGCGICTANYHAGREGDCLECGVEL